MPSDSAAPATDMFGDPDMAEDLRELDFEGQLPPEAAAPPETPEAPEEETFSYEEFGPVAPADMWQALQEADVDGLDARLESEGWTAEQAAQAAELLEQLQELAEDDPVAAADYLAQAYSAQVQEQVHAEYAERLQPVFAREHQAAAGDTIDQLAAEFGHDVLEANKVRLAEMIGAHSSHFIYGDQGPLDEAARHDLIRQALMAAEFERQAAYARGDDITQPMDVIEMRHDAFGRTLVPARAQPSQGQPPAVAAPAPAAAPRDPRAVHVEGGSTPAPSAARGPAVDPIIAEMDALSGGRDMFGRGGPFVPE